MSDILHVRLLGQFSVRAGDRGVEFPTRSAQLLLAYLVIRAGTPQSREHLAATFWPDSTPDNARSNLRHALWQLRKALGDAEKCLVADDFAIAFVPAAGCDVDVAELVREATATRADEQLMAATAAYEGELLPGFYEPWVVLERERLEAVFERKMELLLGRLLAAGRWSAAVGCAERWIALGATPEPAYRALMEAHARLGHISQVQAAFERCRDGLGEIGLTPSAETVALYERLILPGHDHESAADGDRSAPAAQPPGSTWPDDGGELERQLMALRELAERERQLAEAHRRAATRATRLAGGLALALAGLAGAWLRDRARR